MSYNDDTTADVDVDELTRSVYAAYSQASGGKTHDGKPMPAYDDLAHVQPSWQAAALAAYRAGQASAKSGAEAANPNETDRVKPADGSR
jgi:hypothetical protein